MTDMDYNTRLRPVTRWTAMFQIHVSFDSAPTPLPSGELLLVGRGDHCDIRLDDPSASRVHCRLLSRGGKVSLTDAGSRWGTFVNGQRVSDCELQPGDEIRVGETILRLAVASRPDSSTLARPSQLRRDGLGPRVVEALQGSDLDADSPPREDRPHHWPGEQPVSATPARRSPHIRPQDFIGRIFADCHVEELLTRTRSGLLFRAVRGGRSVVLKLLQPQLLATDATRQRFLRGIETARNLRHPGVVTLYDGGIRDGIPYAVSEFISGESVSRMIPRIGVAGMLDWRTTLRIANDLTEVLVHLESHGVLHRNITPQHILIRASDGSAWLSDLLLSKSLDDVNHAITRAGETVGELPYLSPEQVGSGQPIDHRSDIYQLGATLYALLTGHPPFEGRGPAEVIQRILSDPPVAPTRYHLAIPPQLEGIVLTMLQKRPADRFNTAADLLTGLTRVREFTAGTPISAAGHAD